MVIVAKYPSQCTTCGVAIPAGAHIEWDRASRTSRHPGCPVQPQQPVQPIVPIEWFRARWSRAQRLAESEARGINWTWALQARKDATDLIDCGTAFVVGPDLYIEHGGSAPKYIYTYARLAGDAKPYGEAVAAAIPETVWPSEGELKMGGYYLKRLVPFCLILERPRQHPPVSARK